MPSFWPSMARPTPPFSSNSRTIRSATLGGAPISSSWARSAAASAARLGAQQVLKRGVELGEARPQQSRRSRPRFTSPATCSAAGRRCGAGGPCEAWSNRASRTCSGTSARVELAPQRVHAEQPLGGDEGGGGLAEGGALLLGQREGRDDAEPVDEAVGDLGGDDLAAQPVLRGSRRRAAPASACGKASQQLRRRGSDRRSSLPLSIAACSAHLRGRQQHRQLGPGEAADSPGRGGAAPRCSPAPRPRG